MCILTTLLQNFRHFYQRKKIRTLKSMKNFAKLFRYFLFQNSLRNGDDLSPVMLQKKRAVLLIYKTVST